MLIGNRNRFALELAPVEPSWDARYAPEGAAWAGLSVWVDGKNLCEHVRSGEEEVRRALYVPLGPIADWFVRALPGLAFEERFPRLAASSPHLHQMMRKWGESFPPAGVDEDGWLDSREAFWARHFLLAGADGARLPNLAFLRQDDEVRLVWAAPPSAKSADLTFVSAEGMFVAPWSDFEAAIARFVQEVATGFKKKDLSPYAWVTKPQPHLHGLRARSVEPIALYCARPLDEVATLLGVREAELDQVLGIEGDVQPAASPLCQILRDLPPQPSRGVGNEAQATVETSRAAGTRPEIWLSARLDAIDAARAGPRAEEAGLFAATALRHRLKANGEPIDIEKLLDHLGVECRESQCTTLHEHMFIAAVPGHKAATTILRSPQTSKVWGRRFEQARALGHALLDPLRSDALGAASTNWSQDVRRRRSGAFAAELLLPRSALERASGGHLDSEATLQGFKDLLQRYGVGASTAAYQLYNKRLISKPIRDELIVKYASEA